MAFDAFDGFDDIDLDALEQISLAKTQASDPSAPAHSSIGRTKQTSSFGNNSSSSTFRSTGERLRPHPSRATLHSANGQPSRASKVWQDVSQIYSGQERDKTKAGKAFPFEDRGKTSAVNSGSNRGGIRIAAPSAPPMMAPASYQSQFRSSASVTAPSASSGAPKSSKFSNRRGSNKDGSTSSSAARSQRSSTHSRSSTKNVSQATKPNGNITDFFKVQRTSYSQLLLEIQYVSVLLSLLPFLICIQTLQRRAACAAC